MFQEGAELVLEFAFETLNVHRLEARAAVKNGRGNGALHKLGAVQEGVLRKSFLRNGEYLDQVLYAIVRGRLARLPREKAQPRLLRERSLRATRDLHQQGPTFGSALLFSGFEVATPRSIGLAGSLDHSLHDPGYSFAPGKPACSSASRF